MSQGGYKIRNQGGIHFITFTLVNWIDLFTRRLYRNIIIESLIFCQKEKGLIIYAYVIMSNHIHLIVRSSNENLSNIVRDFKSFTCKKIVEAIISENESRKEWVLKMLKEAALKNSRNNNYQIWIQNNHPIELETNEMMEQRLNYIHNNPVKAGIVRNPEDYLYSSASNYTSEYGLLKVELIN